MKNRPNAIIIMDGYGKSENTVGNAVKGAKTPNFDRYFKEYPHTYIGASGENVGLPDGQMGNSEVGHLNMGAGRIVYQELTLITKHIKDGEFFENEELNLAMDNALKKGKKLHFYGLLSDGGVHSHITHLYALLSMAKKKGVKNVFVHCFMDGRDVSPTSGAGFIKDLQNKMSELGVGKIASVSGRYYAMDRDNRWERVQKAYNVMVGGVGNSCTNPYDYVNQSYKEGVTDEFIVPAYVTDGGEAVGKIEKGDSIIFYNFRPDRARQLTRAMSEREFSGFDRISGFIDPLYVCFTRYDDSFTNVKIAFKPQTLNNTLGEYLAKQNLKQLRIAETEKYAHVTFFFNGGVEKPNEGEDRDLIPSPKVATYDLQPEMSAYKVTEKLLEELSGDKYDVIILNFANCDMVGHTGVYEAAVKAVEAVDECLGKVVDKILAMGGAALITADHGNAEKMLDGDSKPFTAHTTNPVPFIVACDRLKGAALREGGILADVAPTLLDIMDLPVPDEMTGKSLLNK